MICFELLFQPILPSLENNYLPFTDTSLMTSCLFVMTLTILMNSPLNELEQICIGIAANYIGLNMGLLNDLLLNGILCDLPLSILLVSWQLTVMQQPIELISHLIGNGQPLVE